MTEKDEVEVFIMIDACGYTAVGGSEEDAKLAFASNIGRPELPVRITKHIALLTRPAIQDGPEISISDDNGTIETEAA